MLSERRPAAFGGTMRTGHRRLPDGSLMRVDIELGRWVGRLYTPEKIVATLFIGSEAEVRAWAARISGQLPTIQAPGRRHR